MGLFGFGKTKGAGPYTGPSIRIDPSTFDDSVTTSTSSSSSLYAERLKNKFNLGVPGRASATAASDAASDYVPRAQSPARRGARGAGETSSGVRQALGPAPLANRQSVSRSMDEATTRRILAARGQLRGLEGKGTVPTPGSRSAGRPVKTNAGGRPVASGYGSMVNHRQAQAQAQASAAARNNMGLAGRGTRPNPHNAGGYRGMTKESYKRANSAQRAAVTGGGRPPGRVTKFAGGGSPPRFPGGALKGIPAAAATSGMNAPVVPAMPNNPSLIGRLGQLQGGYAGVVGDSVRKVQAETREARAPMRRDMLQRARNNAAYTGARRGTTGAGAGAGAGVIDTAISGGSTPIAREAIEKTGKKGFMRSGRGMLIGAGAAVVAGLAYSGKRGEGSSGGRTSQYRY